MLQDARYRREDPELKTFEWDIFNPDRIINLEIKNERQDTGDRTQIQ